MIRDGDSSDEVAVGDVAVVAGGNDQVLAALAAVGSRAAHVDDEAEPGVVDGARPATGRDLDDGRAVAIEVEDARRRRRCRCCRSGTAALESSRSVDDADLVAAVDADARPCPMPHGLERRGGDAAEEHLDAAQEVEVVDRASAAVSSVGNPSVNSSVPIRVSTRSGVMILAGAGVLYPSGFTVSLTVGDLPCRGRILRTSGADEPKVTGNHPVADHPGGMSW